jgi:hypothetical protein
MSKLFTGSLCLTDILEKAKAQHSAFVKGQSNGKIYVNIKVWENDQRDKFGNTMSFQLNSTKEMRDIEGNIYIGNAKPSEAAQPTPITSSDVEHLSSDLPF